MSTLTAAFSGMACLALGSRSARQTGWSHPEQMIEPCGSGRNDPSSLWFSASPVGGPRNEPPVPAHHGDSKVLVAAGV